MSTYMRISDAESEDIIQFDGYLSLIGKLNNILDELNSDDYTESTFSTVNDAKIMIENEFISFVKDLKPSSHTQRGRNQPIDVETLQQALASLASCIRDGIERNYGSWYEWQSIARDVLCTNSPQTYEDLDDISTVMPKLPPKGSDKDESEVAR